MLHTIKLRNGKVIADTEEERDGFDLAGNNSVT